MPIKQDRKICHQFIKSQLSKLLKIAKQTLAFKHYLQTNKENLLPAIMYEVQNFLADKNYKISEQVFETSIHKVICEEIASAYNRLLVAFGETEVEHQPLNKLSIKEFYKQQLMQHHADKILIQTASAA